MWSGFYRRSIDERRQIVSNHVGGGAEGAGTGCGEIEWVCDACDVSLERAEAMVENLVDVLPMPFSVGLNFVIDGVRLPIPMVTEEASVVAAASFAAKTVAQGGGFHTEPPARNLMIGQILLEGAVGEIDLDSVVEQANSHCLRMVGRGGGAVWARVRPVDANSVVEIAVDVCEAMGANCVNDICEHVAPIVEHMCGKKALACIVSNHCPFRLTKDQSQASFRIHTDQLSYRGFSGIEVAEGIAALGKWAQVDEFRGATHIKGIMNGIDAVAVACGQDWRAIDSSCYAFAYGQARPLTSYRVADSHLCGQIELPLPVGVVGGAVSKSPLYARKSLGMLGFPSSKRLAQALASDIMAAVGLAQNFAALRALATVGIQKGHMALHSRKSLANHTAGGAAQVSGKDHLLPFSGEGGPGSLGIKSELQSLCKVLEGLERISRSVQSAPMAQKHDLVELKLKMLLLAKLNQRKVGPVQSDRSDPPGESTQSAQTKDCDQSELYNALQIQVRQGLSHHPQALSELDESLSRGRPPFLAILLLEPLEVRGAVLVSLWLEAYYRAEHISAECAFIGQSLSAETREMLRLFVEAE